MATLASYPLRLRVGSQKVLSDFRKVFDRHTHFQEKQPLDLSKPVIKKTIRREWSRIAKTRSSKGACPNGLLLQLPPTYLDDHPITFMN